jgi:hypothetical protein
MNKKKVLSFTGGSTQGVGLSAIGIGILEKYNPNIIIVESVSAIFAIPLILKRNNILKSAMMEFTKDDIFGKYKPLNKKDSFVSFRAFFRVLFGKESLGKQDALVVYIKKYLTEKMYLEWKNNSNCDILVATANYTTGLLEYFNLRDYCYDEALNIILASCNIPVIINGISIDNDYHYDGGILKANPGIEYLKNECKNISHYYSVWNRPNSTDSIELLYEKFRPKSIVNVFARTLELMIKNQSLSNEYLEDSLCEINNIKHKKYFFKTSLSSLYDSDLKDKLIDWQNGLDIGKE